METFKLSIEIFTYVTISLDDNYDTNIVNAEETLQVEEMTEVHAALFPFSFQTTVLPNLILISIELPE